MINTTQPIHTATIQDQAVVRALSSIKIEQAEEIGRVVRAAGSAWDDQVSDDYDGYLSILVQPTIAGAASLKSFFISGTMQRLELFENHGDDLSLIGTFSDVDFLAARLLSLLNQQ